MTEKEFARPLALVTPLIHDSIRVRDAQYLLSNNRFPGLAPYKDGKKDDIYGPLTAQATARAKYWLGYPDSGIDGIFGQTLYEYLRKNHWRPLPAGYRARREERLKKAASTPGLNAWKKAQEYLGYHEEPHHGVNDSMFGRWYGLNYEPWCAMFESYCFAHTGWHRFMYSYVGAIYNDAIANRNGLRRVWTPQPGDIVGYRLHGDPYAHTAFFDHWVNDHTFVDLGGNTGPSSISNGGMVMRQEREKDIVSFFARVG